MTYGATPLDQLTGTAHDDSPGELDKIYVQIGYSPSGQGGAITNTYDGAAWQSNSTTWLPVSSVIRVGDNWTYTVPGVIWQWNNGYYSIREYSVDKANNAEATIWRKNFRYSAPVPDTWIETPANNVYMNSKPQTIRAKRTNSPMRPPPI